MLSVGVGVTVPFILKFAAQPGAVVAQSLLNSTKTESLTEINGPGLTEPVYLPTRGEFTLPPL